MSRMLFVLALPHTSPRHTRIHTCVHTALGQETEAVRGMWPSSVSTQARATVPTRPHPIAPLVLSAGL